MNPVVDTIMIVLFVLFMIFIVRGYHQSKYEERYGEDKGSQDEQESTGPSSEPSEK